MSFARPSRRLWFCVFFFVIATLLSNHTAHAVYVEPTLNPADAETPWRWIGVLNAFPPCPVAPSPGWAVRPLFPAALWPYDPELARFCVYEWAGPWPIPPFLSPPGFAQLYPDRMALAPAAEDQNGELWQTLATAFEEHAGATPLIPSSSKAPTRVAVIDTSPTRGTNPQGLPETSPHGQTLRKLLHRLLCSPNCVADVTPRLALAYTSFDPNQQGAFQRNLPQGGHFGTLGELAEAIGAELVDWLALGNSKPPLVINLSVAWDPIYGGASQDLAQMLPDVLAVYRAIEAVSCQGAIVVAAAGNLSDRRGDNFGPMLPALWGKRILAPEPFCSLAGDPMLYAAGGVRADGDPLANARPRSAPVLAAYGDHGVIEDADEPGEPTPILTGSSVAAVVVSAAAAAVAHHRPELSPAEVMELVAGSSEPLDRRADFCTGSRSCPLVGYVSLCEAVRQACGSSWCSVPPPFCPRRSFEAIGLAETALERFATAPVVKVGDFLEPYPLTQGCGEEVPFYLPGQEPIDPCPSFQRYGSAPRPWTVPQPNQDPCPNCLVVKRRDQPSGGSGLLEGEVSGTFYLDLDPSFEGRLSDATLTLCPGSSPLGYNLETGEELTMLQLTELTLTDCDEALLSFTLDGSQSITVPVLVSE